MDCQLGAGNCAPKCRGWKETTQEGLASKHGLGPSICPLCEETKAAMAKGLQQRARTASNNIYKIANHI